MGLVIVASIIAFITTEMDDLLVMFVLFSKVNRKRENGAVIIGKYLGLFCLIAADKLFTDTLEQLPCKQLLGLLGILPIVLGIRYAVKEYSGENGPAENEGVIIRLYSLFSLVLESFLITLANGGDNIAVCLSFFSSLNRSYFFLSCTVFCIMQALWCLIAISVMNAASIRKYTEESKGVIIPVLFVVLGLYILIQNGTAVWLFSQGQLPD